MKRAFLAIFLLLLIALPGGSAAEWYEGGKLHESTVRHWHMAAKRNKIATMADWIMTSCDQEILREAGMDAWRKATVAVVRCVDEGTAGIDLVRDHDARDYAHVCMDILRPSHPFLARK